MPPRLATSSTDLPRLTPEFCRRPSSAGRQQFPVRLTDGGTMRWSNLVLGTTVPGHRGGDGSTRAPGAAGGEGRGMAPGAPGTADRRSDSATRVERRHPTSGAVGFRPPTGAAPAAAMRVGAMRGTSTRRTPPPRVRSPPFRVRGRGQPASENRAACEEEQPAPGYGREDREGKPASATSSTPRRLPTAIRRPHHGFGARSPVASWRTVPSQNAAWETVQMALPVSNHWCRPARTPGG